MHSKNVFPTDIPHAFPIQFDKNIEPYIFTNKYISLIDSEKKFYTIISKIGIIGGYHEIETSFTQASFVKIGFTTRKTVESGECFSDYDDGFAYFNIGQLRNGSNLHGNLYGPKVFNRKNKCDFKVICKLIKSTGIISFKIDDKDYDVAF